MPAPSAASAARMQPSQSAAASASDTREVREVHDTEDTQDTQVAPGDVLVLPFHKRVVTRYAKDAYGVTELHLYYGEKEISFDEPDLFGFGEVLARQSRFTAGEAMQWGGEHAWTRVQGLLEQLLEEGVLARASDEVVTGGLRHAAGACPAPLPPGLATIARDWADCEAITRELTGRGLEPGWLELVVPVFRVAHVAMDAEGRQVGESNVFPKALRMDVETRWRTCLYEGSRYQCERPMNVTALKSMRAHWPQMMAALASIRAAWLQRFPEARSGWTVGQLERLATCVLAVPTLAWLRESSGDGSGAAKRLHPALSSLFRVTDGLRMTMHQMLFVPIGEPTLAPDAPMTSAEILSYAERNYSFHSEHGVCAGPTAMVAEFLAVLVDGRLPSAGLESPVPAVRDALDAVDAAIDYGLLGLQAHAAVFSVFPSMTRTYEQLASIVRDPLVPATPAVAALRERLDECMRQITGATYLGREQWRVDRERVYGDMFDASGRGVRAGGVVACLLAAASVPAVAEPVHEVLRRQLAAGVARHLGIDAAGMASQIARCLVDHAVTVQRLLRVGCEAQQRINDLTGRARPTRAFTAADIDLHNRLQGSDDRRLPFLLDEIEPMFGLALTIDPCRIALADLQTGGVA